MRMLSAAVLLVLLAGPCYAQQICASYAKEDITPTEPVEMGGYNLRGAAPKGFTKATGCLCGPFASTTALPPCSSSRAI